MALSAGKRTDATVSAPIRSAQARESAVVRAKIKNADVSSSWEHFNGIRLGDPMPRITFTAPQEMMFVKHIVRYGLTPSKYKAADDRADELFAEMGCAGPLHVRFTQTRILEALARRARCFMNTEGFEPVKVGVELLEFESTSDVWRYIIHICCAGGDRQHVTHTLTVHVCSFRYPDFMQCWLDPEWNGDTSRPPAQIAPRNMNDTLADDGGASGLLSPPSTPMPTLEEENDGEGEGEEGRQTQCITRRGSADASRHERHRIRLGQTVQQDSPFPATGPVAAARVCPVTSVAPIAPGHCTLPAGPGTASSSSPQPLSQWADIRRRQGQGHDSMWYNPASDNLMPRPLSRRPALSQLYSLFPARPPFPFSRPPASLSSLPRVAQSLGPEKGESNSVVACLYRLVTLRRESHLLFHQRHIVERQKSAEAMARLHSQVDRAREDLIRLHSEQEDIRDTKRWRAHINVSNSLLPDELKTLILQSGMFKAGPRAVVQILLAGLPLDVGGARRH